MSKYKCDKCGMESEMIPTEHGYFEHIGGLFGKPVGHKKCSGTFALVGVDERWKIREEDVNAGVSAQ